MKNKLLKFLKENLRPQKSVLLALSGGPDSLALLHLLLECRKKIDFTLGIAHVDHGWRKESAFEAKQLREMAEKLDLPFYLKKLDPSKMSGNLENECRIARQTFFAELCQKFGYIATLLAHQENDQAETALKKLFEGSTISFCSGMKAITHFENLTVWRPLLDIPKKNLIKYLDEKKISAFQDPTNDDPKTLRVRFRKEIIPHLSKTFGKDISASLAHLSRECNELELFLQDKLENELSSIEKSPFGYSIDFSKMAISTRFEIRYLIRKTCQKLNCFPSRIIIEKASEHILKGLANKKFIMGEICLFIDRKKLFVTNVNFAKLPNERIKLTSNLKYGYWQIIAKETDYSAESASHWQKAWQGGLTLFLPPNLDYEIGPAKLSYPYPGSSSIDKWWNKHKIPAFLRNLVPVIWVKNKIYHEFLTGKICYTNKNTICQSKMLLNLKTIL